MGDDNEVNKRSRGKIRSSLMQKSQLKFPGFPRSRNLFQSSLKKSPDLRPERSVVEPSAAASKRVSIAASGNQHPAGSGLNLDRKRAFGSWPQQVAVGFSPEGDPSLVWVRPNDRFPVTF